MTEQEKIINHLNGPAAVLASAGSGKTYTLIERIKKLSATIEPSRLVMLTFTNAAADEMKFRAAKANDKCKDVLACTYHKYCGLMLRRYGKEIGIEPSFEILTSMKYRTLIEYVKSSNEYYESLKNFPSASKLDKIFSILANCDDVSLSSLIYNTKYSMYEADILNLYNEVKKYGLENQKLNFDDMLVYMNQLLDNKDICYKIANSFDYLMVDEFQDTNTLQLQILLKLSRYNSNILIVGDISQSIYRFRGAKVTNIQDFIDSTTDCQVYILSTNYRSTQEILDAVNSIMNQNVYSWKYTNMVSNDKHGNKPKLVKNTTELNQANWIIDKINQYIGEGYDLSQIAIIERSSMSSFRLENELVRNDIPFIKRGGLKLTDYNCVDDIISFLSVLVKNDTFSWFNILNLIPGIGGKTATEISKHCKEKDFVDLYEKKKYYDNLVSLNEHIIEFAGYKKNLSTLLDLLYEYYKELRLKKIESSKSSSSIKFDAREKLDRDMDVLNILKDMSTNYSTVKEFLEDIALDSIKSAEDLEDNLIITTIHSAKGLEWPIVIMIDSIEKDNVDEEELRCLYVAMTRAENELYVSIPMTSIVNGIPMYNDYIRFIEGSEEYFTKD